MARPGAFGVIVDIKRISERSLSPALGNSALDVVSKMKQGVNLGAGQTYG